MKKFSIGLSIVAILSVSQALADFKCDYKVEAKQDTTLSYKMWLDQEVDKSQAYDLYDWVYQGGPVQEDPYLEDCRTGKLASCRRAARILESRMHQECADLYSKKLPLASERAVEKACAQKVEMILHYRGRTRSILPDRHSFFWKGEMSAELTAPQVFTAEQRHEMQCKTLNACQKDYLASQRTTEKGLSELQAEFDKAGCEVPALYVRLFDEAVESLGISNRASDKRAIALDKAKAAPGIVTLPTEDRPSTSNADEAK